MFATIDVSIRFEVADEAEAAALIAAAHERAVKAGTHGDAEDAKDSIVDVRDALQYLCTDSAIDLPMSPHGIVCDADKVKDLDEDSRRKGLAARFVAGTLTVDDAFTLIRECEAVAGCYPLEFIDVDGVKERILDGYQEHPALDEMCDRAASRVADKWDSTGDISSAAIDWAADLVAEYAKDRGEPLVPLSDDGGAGEREAADTAAEGDDSLDVLGA